MSSSRAEFRVEKPLPRDSGSSKATISSDTLDDLGWSSGGVVEIRGTEKAVATVASSRSGETEDRDVRLDVFTRENAGVSIGDAVEVNPVDSENADSLVVSVPKEAPTPEIESTEIRRRLRGTPVKQNQYVPVRSNRDPRQSTPLIVRETRPEGVVVVSENTEIRTEETDEPNS